MEAREAGDGSARLILGDCLGEMQRIHEHSIDLVLTDPPYGINYQGRHRKKEKRFDKIKNDNAPFLEFVPELPRVLKPSGCALIFSRWDVQQTFIDALRAAGMLVKNVVIWDKMTHGTGDLRRSFGGRYETIIFAVMEQFRFPGRRPQDVIQQRRVPPQQLVHPNQKPVELLERLIDLCSPPGSVVLDPFTGSGSTGVACVRTGRRFVGMEMDGEYFNVASNRITQAVAEGSQKSM